MTEHVTDRMVDVGGYRLRAVEQGKGPLVLMIHGFPGLAWSWRHQMQPLAKAGYRAVAIDNLGYGCSDRPADPEAYTTERMQDYLLAVLDHYGAGRAIIGRISARNMRGTSPCARPIASRRSSPPFPMTMILPAAR